MSNQNDEQNQNGQAKQEEPTVILQSAEPETEATPHDSRRVIIRRKPGQTQQRDENDQPVFEHNKKKEWQSVMVDHDEPLTRLSYEYKGGIEHVTLPADKNRFELPALVAAAAVATGYFEQDPASRTRLK